MSDYIILKNRSFVEGIKKYKWVALFVVVVIVAVITGIISYNSKTCETPTIACPVTSPCAECVKSPCPLCPRCPTCPIAEPCNCPVCPAPN